MNDMRMAAGSTLFALLLTGGCANTQQENQSAPANVEASPRPGNTALPASESNQTDAVESNNAQAADNTNRADGRPWPSDITWFRDAVRFCRVWQYQQVVRSEAQIAQIRSDCARLRDTHTALTRQYAGDAEVAALLREIGGPESF